MARTLVANNDLPKVFASGQDQADEAVHLLQPVPGERGGEPARVLRRVAIPVREAMVAQIMSVFDPPAFVAQPAAV